MDSVVLLAFLVTLGAGLATGIGSAMAFFTKQTNQAFLSVSLGFSAGVMIYLSFVEILPKANGYLAASNGEIAGATWAAVGFIGGLVLMAVIDAVVPSFTNPHENVSVEQVGDEAGRLKFMEQRALLRTGTFVALAIAIHNFPEGLATFFMVLENPSVGIALALAVALHNIPEGIAVSVPIFYATGKRGKAFAYSFLSGLAEPVGAVVGYLILRPFISDGLLGMLFAMVAGVMVFISLDSLLPAARSGGRSHLAIYGLIAGMGIMAGSLILLAA